MVCQGAHWKTAKVAAFFSAKLNPAQRNYVQGAKFTWLTDHKGLIHLLERRTCCRTLCLACTRQMGLASMPITPSDEDAPGPRRSARVAARPPTVTPFAPTRRKGPPKSLETATPPPPPAITTAEDRPPQVAPPSRRVPPRPRPTLPPAESGRPETSKEFARRMRDRFVLLGPGDRKKGGEEGDNYHPDPEPQHEHPETEQFQPAVPIKVPEDHEETLSNTATSQLRME